MLINYLKMVEIDKSLVFSYQNKEFDNNKLTNLDSITVNGNPTTDNEVRNKKCIDDELDRNTIVRFIQLLENHLKVSVGDKFYYLEIYNKQEFINTSLINFSNQCGYLLQQWNIECTDKNFNGNYKVFIRSKKNNYSNG